MTYEEYLNRREQDIHTANQLHALLVEEFGAGNAVYEDAIIDRYGESSLNLLRQEKLVQGCGNICGRKLYAI